MSVSWGRAPQVSLNSGLTNAEPLAQPASWNKTLLSSMWSPNETISKHCNRHCTANPNTRNVSCSSVNVNHVKNGCRLDCTELVAIVEPDCFAFQKVWAYIARCGSLKMLRLKQGPTRSDTLLLSFTLPSAQDRKTHCETAQTLRMILASCLSTCWAQ